MTQRIGSGVLRVRTEEGKRLRKGCGSNMTVEQNVAQECCCGHDAEEHTRYEHGINSKGSCYVCTHDGCSEWAYCDLESGREE